MKKYVKILNMKYVKIVNKINQIYDTYLYLTLTLLFHKDEKNSIILGNFVNFN